MLRVADVVGLKVFKSKKTRKGEEKYSKLGKVHMAVFSPDGMSVVGFTVKRPDVVGMVKRPDFFMARDAFGVIERGLLLTDERDGVDDRARERLGIDWDACIMWTGMDARTSDGKDLGYVNNAVFDAQSGRVQKFCVGDGSVAQSLVGSLEIPADMVRGYSKGYMIVDPKAASLKLSGGAAAVAGEGYAKAKVAGKKTAQKAGAAASVAVDKGSFALGRALGKAKRAIDDARADSVQEEASQEQLPARRAADVSVSAPSEPATLRMSQGERERRADSVKTYAPAGEKNATPAADTTPAAQAATKPRPAKQVYAGKPAAKKAPVKTAAKKKSTSDAAARAVGKELGKMGSMFGSFMDEYKKASK